MLTTIGALAARCSSTKAAIHVDEGGPISRVTASTIGRALPTSAINLILTGNSYSDPSRDWSMQKDPKRRKGHEDIAKTLSKSDPEALKDTVLRLGGTDLVDDIIWKKERDGSLPWHKQIGGRVAHNPRTSVLGKLLGIPSSVIASLITPLTRAPHYNPESDAAVQYWNEPAVTSHELGHALDFNTLYGMRPGHQGPGLVNRAKQEAKGLARDIYRLSYSLPGVNLIHETRANAVSDAALKSELGAKSDKYKKLNERRWETLTPGIGSYVGNAVHPLAALPGMAIGKVVGLQHARRLREQRESEIANTKAKKQPRDGDGDGEVMDGTAKARPKAASLYALGRLSANFCRG